MLHKPIQGQMPDFAFVGIGIQRVGPDLQGRHVGLLYRRGDGSVRQSHLRWHKRFSDEPWDGSFYWAHPGDLDEVDAPVLAARLASIEELRPSIPYGFVRRGCRFQINAQGEIHFDAQRDVGAGLTCATYVLAVMDSIDFQLLKEETWQPRAEDVTWQQEILADLKRTPTVSQPHLDSVAKTVGIERFRPEEVVGAFASAPAPIPFEQAIGLAQEVLADLEA